MVGISRSSAGVPGHTDLGTYRYTEIWSLLSSEIVVSVLGYLATSTSDRRVAIPIVRFNQALGVSYLRAGRFTFLPPEGGTSPPPAQRGSHPAQGQAAAKQYQCNASHHANHGGIEVVAGGDAGGVTKRPPGRSDRTAS